MAIRMHVVAASIDGKELEATGPYMALGDIIAFEERFGVRFTDVYVDERDEDGSLARREGPAYTSKRASFFAWRTLTREGADAGDFDAWADQLDSLIISREAEELDPTELEDPASD